MFSPIVRPTLGLAAVLSVVASVGACLHTGSVGQALRSATSPAPRGGLSLQLPLNDDQARQIVAYWARTPDPAHPDTRRLSDVAKDALGADYLFILSYVVALLLCVGWAILALNTADGAPKLSPSVSVFVAAPPLLAGLFDLVENRLLTYQLDASLPLVPGLPASWNAHLASVIGTHAAALGRTASMMKFIAFMFAVLAALAFLGAALRVLLARDTPGDQPRRRRFGALIAQENTGIFYNRTERTPDDPVVVEDNTAAEEPWVAFRAADITGLALSGGGIRSATFNLGLLQGLHQLNLLRLFDYVSTVSGGGYVGSMWSEWLARRRDAAFADCAQLDAEMPNWPVPPKELFPPPPTARPQLGDIESAPERHLREFSRFLAPRWGFFEVEMWTALVALLSGLLPAMAIGLSVMGALTIVWLSMAFPLACAQPVAGSLAIMSLTALTLAGFERFWQSYKADELLATSSGSASAKEKQTIRYYAFALSAVLLVCVLQAAVPHVYLALSSRWFSAVHSAVPVYIGGWQTAIGQGGFERWWWVVGVQNDRRQWIVSPRLFDYGLVWLAAAVSFIGVRLLFAVAPKVAARTTIASFDRVLMRLLGLGVIWCAIGLVWHVAINIGQIRVAITAALVSGGAFAALRNWIGVAFRRPTQGGILDRIKPYVPQILAYVTLVLAAGVMGFALIRFCGADWLRWWSVALLQGLVLVFGLFILPGEFGLHQFYRERISRAYSGASNLSPTQSASDNRGTEPRDGDDRRLSRLVGRPLHLICCAANDLTGDPVRTLSRGARSAVLSRCGLSIGPYAARQEDLRLGAAVTASAAAFNSNMGKVSLEVGPAVSFLMTMLNLRLGMWLRHPAAGEVSVRRWPGVLFYREMFGYTAATGNIVTDRQPPLLLRDVHLSDGGHFENLALYELIRRHCRYIIVSDCGADPEVAFDDLGNALRRIREDFGVDVTLDVSPLRPTDDRSVQHVAIGTIHYSKTDRGILLYVKPTLTGDEPTDVLQYKARNTAFPHESTTDQFYDEAQWESYRRLGLHAAECIFDFVHAAGRDDTARLTSDWLFAQSVYRWGPTPAGLMDRVLEMTKRFAEAESRLIKEASRGLVTEVFPELVAGTHAHAPAQAQAPANMGDQPPSSPPSVAADLMLLVRVTQLMEDAWTACDLDTWWHHPLNLGWINTFARWATAPSFKFWWPIIAPMFSPGFRNFIEDRFPTPPPVERPTEKYLAGVVQRGRVAPFTESAPGATHLPLAELWWKTRSTQPRHWEGRRLFQNLVVLGDQPSAQPDEVQVGIAAVTIQGDPLPKRAGWTSDDFFVPPSLWGTGLGWYFLDNLLGQLHTDGFTDCYVVVKAPPQWEQTKVAIDDRRSFIEQYRKMGFRQRLFREFELLSRQDLADFRNSIGNFDDAFARTLGYTEDATDRRALTGGERDTLLVLDLLQWAASRR